MYLTLVERRKKREKYNTLIYLFIYISSMKTIANKYYDACGS